MIISQQTTVLNPSIGNGSALWKIGNLPYFSGYNTEFFSFKKNPQNLDPSHKMDLDLWDCLGKVKLVL